MGYMSLLDTTQHSLVLSSQEHGVHETVRYYTTQSGA